MGLPDDNPSSFGDHYGFGLNAGLDGLSSCWHNLALFLSNCSAKNLLINSHQAHQIAAHPFHHLPIIGLSDDNPSSFGDHYGFGRHAGLDGLASCLHNFSLLVQLFSQKPPDQQPSSTSDCCSSFPTSPNGSTSSFEDHYGFGRHAGLDGLLSWCWLNLVLFV
jgi:hypothetical protein